MAVYSHAKAHFRLRHATTLSHTYFLQMRKKQVVSGEIVRIFITAKFLDLNSNAIMGTTFAEVILQN